MDRTAPGWLTDDELEQLGESLKTMNTGERRSLPLLWRIVETHYETLIIDKRELQALIGEIRLLKIRTPCLSELLDRLGATAGKALALGQGIVVFSD